MVDIVDGTVMTPLGASIEVAEIASLAKGTIIVGDGSGAPAAAAIGADNTILQADSAQATGCVWRSEIGIGIAPTSGSRLTLPQENDAVTPTLAFGDGDTGFYELGDDNIVVALGGAGRFQFLSQSFFGNNANAASLLNEVASGTNPTLIPDRADDDTGIGHSAADQLSLIAGGLEGLRVTEAAAAIIVDLKCSPGTSVGGFASGGLHVTSPSTLVNANAVITGHNSNAGNKQLWYLGSASSSDDRIALINRQNSDLTLHTNDTERFRIEPGGSVAIGTSSALGQLHVRQPSATGAQPALYLEQEDLSEEMIEFDSTIGVGNAIEAVGAKLLTTTHFIKVTLPGGLTRYLPVGTIV